MLSEVYAIARQGRFAYRLFPSIVIVQITVILAAIVAHHAVAPHMELIQEVILTAEMGTVRAIRFGTKDLHCHQHQSGTALRQDCLTRIFTGR